MTGSGIFLVLGLLSGALAAQQYAIFTYAGGAPLAAPAADWDISIAVDAAGNQYFAGQNTVFKRDAEGVVTRVAGNSRPGFTGDGGPAVNARLQQPWNVAVDASGNIFIADLGNLRVRKVSPDGIITTVAGNGNPQSSGDGGPATDAGMTPIAVAVDNAGNLFIAHAYFGIFLSIGGDNRVRKVSPDGIITTVAGGGANYAGDGGPATSAFLSTPYRVAVDGAGNLYIAEPLNGRVREVFPDGTITTIAGTKSLDQANFGETCTPGTGNGVVAKSAKLCMPFSVAVDSAGNVFAGEFGYRCCYDIEDAVLEDFAVRQISPGGIIGTVANSHTPGVSSCNCADVANATVALDSGGNLFFSDSLLSLEIAADGTVTTLLGDDSSHFAGDGGPATRAQLWGPSALATDGAGNLFIADTNNNRIRKVSPDGVIVTIAGADTAGFSGDGGPAATAQFKDVTGLALDNAGNLYVADRRNGRVRKISPDGIVTTVAGGGADLALDGGPATSAQLNYASAVAVDGAGNLFIADGPRLRKLSTNGIITTVAGVWVQGLAVDSAGNLLFAAGSYVRKISIDGAIATLAGDGMFGYSGDGGPATRADLTAYALAVDKIGHVYVADADHNAVRILRPERNSRPRP